jgi:MFS family permease
MGSEMTAIALPWFVLTTTGSPARMGAVLAAEFLGMALLGIWGGRVATVVGPRRMMLGSDLSRAVLIALVPVLYWLGALSLPVIMLIGLVVGGFFPAYSSSQRLVIAGLVGDDELRLARLGGLLGSANETASFIGPALGGVLVVLIGPTNVLLFDAGTYLFAFALVAALVPGPAHVSDGETGVLEGLRYLLGNTALRRQVIGIGFVEVGWTAMVATVPLLALHHGGARVAGWLLAAYGLGSVGGGLIASRARTTAWHVAALAIAGVAVATWLLLLPVPVWTLAFAVALNGVCAGVFFPRFFSALTTGTPPRLRARVMTSVTIAISAPGPVGFLGAGALAQYTGSTVPCLVLVATAATVGAAITITGLVSRSRTAQFQDKRAHAEPV